MYILDAEAGKREKVEVRDHFNGLGLSLGPESPTPRTSSNDPWRSKGALRILTAEMEERGEYEEFGAKDR